MKTSIVKIILVLGCGLLMTNCDYEKIRVSDEITVREIRLTDYTGLKVANAFTAYVTFSDTEEKIEIEANDNLHDRIIVQKEGNDLIVKLQRQTNVKGKAVLNVYITTKTITGFEASGASAIRLENALVAQNVSLDLAGASAFFGEVDVAQRLHMRLSGASHSTIYGSVRDLDALLSGSSGLRDYDLVLDHLDIELTGASDAYLTVNEAIDVKASGASVLNYKGSAVVNNQDLSGASQVNHRD